jgi:hypothetical protein
MKLMKKSDWVAISAFLLVLTVIALWCIDISISAMLSGGYLTNGFSISDPFKQYHVGLYIVILATFSNFLIILHIILKDSVYKEEKTIGNYEKTPRFEDKQTKRPFVSKRLQP